MFRKVIIAATLCALALVSSGLANSNANPGIIPPEAKAYGKTYGEWTAAWWQWALGVPAETNPILDVTGEFFAEGQGGPVWFYAGSFGFSAERSCTLPAGKALFMPAYNVVFGEAVYDCGASNPGVPCDVETLQATAEANTVTITTLEVTIDGELVQDIFDYRAFSPGAFDITLSEGNLLGLPPGTYSPNVSDGYWLMLAPLTPGEHTIHTTVYGVTPYFGVIEYEVLTHLTVE